MPAIIWLLALLGLLLTPVTLSVLALSLLLDKGCFRGLLFIAGWWVLAPVAGLFFAAVLLILVGMEGNLSAEVAPGVLVFLGGYPIVAFFLHRYFDRLPAEEREAWKDSLTSGALLGLGGGAAGKVITTAAAGGFGGFGGGSFGGGGAGGSFKGGAAVSGGSAKVASASAGSAAGGAGSASAGSAAAAAGATAATVEEMETRAGNDRPAGARSSDGASATSKEDGQGEPGLLSRFGIGHVVGFLLVAVAFVPLGIGVTALFQSHPTVVIRGSLVLVGGYGAYRWWAWMNPEAAAAFSAWMARWRPDRYWHRVKRGESSAIPLYLIGGMFGHVFGLVAVYGIVNYIRENEDSADASFKGGAAASSWEG